MNRGNKRLNWAAILLGAAAVTFAHQPVQGQGPEQDKIFFTNKTSLRMPVKIDDKVRAGLKEICLYVKCGAAGWVRQDAAPPNASSFSYQVPQDGEYWFNVVTVDRNGRLNPADVNAVPPLLKVMVDTNPPDVELKSMKTPDGEMCLLCLVKDTHPDYQSLRITYRGSDNVERTLEPHSHKPGLFHIPDPALWGAKVAIHAFDRAKNKILRELTVPNLASSTGPEVVTIPARPSREPIGNSQTAYKPEAFPDIANQDNVFSGGPSLNQGMPPVQVKNLRESRPRDITPPSRLPLKSQSGSQDRLLLNTTHASLDYKIDQVGPSGVGKVEVWITADEGQTWKRLCEDGDRRSPAEIDLPGEGLYGLSLVITNGNGFGGKPPTRGDAPTVWIEVDNTFPFVQLREIEPVTDGGNLEIHWKASDKNLGSNPVTLYFRTRPDSAWQVLAREVKNTGSFRWEFPHDLGSQFFFRLEVTDRAGNVAHADTANPVVLDMTEPRATVVGVTGLTPIR